MDGVKPRFGLHESISFHTSQTARLIERRVEEGLRAFGLTRVGWCILVAVAEDGLKNPSEIASFVGIDRTATSRALRQLEDEGLIARSIGRQDRRTTEVALTPEGRTRMRAAMPICSENMAHFNEKLSASERVELTRLLAKLRSGEGDDPLD
ncbi:MULTISPECIES: MarR family winged helix-turn-helix transcriptional regulator [Paracoccaceae]|jgi:DNA-binding MarR family transcriptional regulator|uniref:MarR family winged helix-turn-helix transcriptional regulator n=1 Tax=Rhodobacterales TaxID=204455 RepID=UPI001B0AAC91|nr:MarR family transcriptional regulator [Boseongicola sp. H5]MBO6603183.1 MarR family transcriptional regulator [Roseicyclus sp.]MBO6623678.1 MarR family transcriptional regulator [Roseicyclus sp.]MBO6922869.1 MarR family transcriptional regulator [Roseicyclus sp.]